MKCSMVGVQLALCVLLFFVGNVALAPVNPSQDIPPNELRSMINVFLYFDRDNDGFISSDDLRNVLDKLNVQRHITEINEMISKADKNKDGIISLDGFLEMMAEYHTTTSTLIDDSEIMDAFCLLDPDSSGHLQVDSLRMLIASVDGTIPQEEIDEMIQIADSDGDGRVNFEDFKTLYNKIMSNAETGGSKPDA